MRTSNLRHGIPLAASLLLFWVLNAGAFDCGYSGSAKVHQDITKEGLALAKGYPVGWDIIVGEMTPEALGEINSYHREMDDNVSGQAMEAWHFDDECFKDGSELLKSRKEWIIKNMLGETGSAYWARYHLGFALHSIEDFYSHGNWVELGHYNGEINTLLGREVIYDPPSVDANNNVTCKSVYHKLLFEYWTYDCDNLGNAGLYTLTTGWAWRPHPLGIKVLHGLKWLGVNWRKGLNKDHLGRDYYEAARSCAVNAAEDYVKQILSDGRIQSASEDKIRRALERLGFGFGPQVHPLDIVLDNSMHMPDARFAEAKGFVQGLVAAHRNKSDEPSSYLLQLYDYAPLEDPLLTSDAGTFLGWLDSAEKATAVGSCAKDLFRAFGNAVDASDHRANLYVFCGNQIGDAGLWGIRKDTVKLKAWFKVIRPTFVVSYKCSPIDPDYYEIADALGGEVVSIETAAMTNLTGLVDGAISGNVVPLLSISGNLATNTVKEFTVPVDSTVTNITFLVSVETNSTITFVTPSGDDLTNAPCCPIYELGLGRSATVAFPAPGNWRIRLEGSGHFSASASAATSIHLSRFGFLKDQSDGGTGDYVPIPGQPTQMTNTAEAFLIGPFTLTNLTWTLVTPGGDPIQPLVMDPDSVTNLWPNGQDGVVFTGTVVLPSQPFKVMASGWDINGRPFQRVFPQITQVQPLEVRSLRNSAQALTPGVPHHVRYVVSNLGSNGVFSVNMTADSAIVTNLGPVNFALASGATNVVEADILLSPGTNSDGALEWVTITVVCTNNPAIFNGLVDRFDVGPAYVGDTTVLSSNSPVTITLSRPEGIANGPAGGNLVLVGGTSTATLDLNGCFETINGLVSQGMHGNTRVTSDRDTTLVVGDQDASATFGGNIMNAVEVVKIGAGMQTLTGANTYTNNTKVVGGVLALEGLGSISNTPLILITTGARLDVSKTSGGWTLNAGQMLTGAGVVTGSVTAASGSWLEAGSGGSTILSGYQGGTPIFANNLTLNGTPSNGVTTVFILNPPPGSALMTVAGDLTLNGINRVLIGHETLSSGVYPLITYGNILTGSAADNLELFCFPPGSRQMAMLDDLMPGEIDLIVDGEAGDLTWVGDGATNRWDMTTTNWINGVTPDRFYAGDSVVFDDSGSRTPAVNLTGTLAPSSIRVDSGTNYTFTGSGSLNTTTLVKTNTGTLVLANSGTNAIHQLQIDGGTVQVGNGGTNGSLGSVTVGNRGRLVFNRSDNVTCASSIGGTGDLCQAGSGTLTLTAINNYSGTTIVSNGVLEVNGSLQSPGAVTAVAGTLGGTGVIMGPVTVQTGATLAPVANLVIWGWDGMALNISNTLSLAGTTSLRLNKTARTNDQVRGITTLTYGGTLVVTNVAGSLAAGDSFKLFSALSYAGNFAAIIPASPGIGIEWLWTSTNGILKVVPAIASNPTNITWTATGTQLTLSWPADHIGWQLEVQTNSLTAGLGTNWFVVPDSAGTNQMTLPIGTTNGSVFYRLKHTP